MPVAYEQELNQEQIDVVQNGDGACLVLAGAGSGKTRVITYRVAWLIDHGVAPANILLLTFTNKAAKEMMGRIQELAGPAAAGVFGGTFHSAANRLLRHYGRLLGYSPDFTILDQDDSKSLIKACIRESGADTSGKRFPSPAVIQEILSYGRNAMIARQDALAKLHPKFGPLAPQIVTIFDLYDKKKRAANSMDFDDLLERWLELLEKAPEVKESLRNRFRHVLVDEFQDTNALQNAIIRRLAPPGHNLLVVGDDAQSIYSFRAADVRNILDFPKYYPDTRVFRLTVNYRSTPEILELANDIISRNVGQFPKELRAVAPKMARPMVVPAVSAAGEASFIADSIEKLEADGIRADRVAVLFRATFHSQALEFELTKRGIAYDYRGGLRFFDRAHVKDVLAFLRVAANPADEASWLRLLNFQEGIGEVTAAKLAGRMVSLASLAKAVIIDPETEFGARAARGWRDLRDCLEGMLKADSPSAMVKTIIKSPYVDYLENEYPNYRERLEDIEQLGKFAESYKKVGDFLAEVTLDDSLANSARDGARARGPRVVLSTIHQAKGLEWDAVFVMHMTASSFPNRNALLEEGGLEEERRLFYVAVTRAKKFLILTHPATVGREMFAFEGPSSFLEEVDPKCLEGGPGCRADEWESECDHTESEEVIELDASGERSSHSLGAVKQRMKHLKPTPKSWKGKSFLRDV